MSSETRVRFSFGSCEESIVFRAIMAAVDQLSATTDVDVSLLDALEVPLAESFAVLFPFGIDEVDVWVDAGRLGVRVGVRSDVGSDTTAVFGDADDLIRSFFDDIDRLSDTCVRMIANLT